MTLEWSEFAIADRLAIFDYIEIDSPQAAAMIDERIQDAVTALPQFPEMGRLGRIAGTRELIIQRTPYIAVYDVRKRAIRVLRVLHGAQKWPGELPR